MYFLIVLKVIDLNSSVHKISISFGDHVGSISGVRDQLVKIDNYIYDTTLVIYVFLLVVLCFHMIWN